MHQMRHVIDACASYRSLLEQLHSSGVGRLLEDLLSHRTTEYGSVVQDIRRCPVTTSIYMYIGQQILPPLSMIVKVTVIVGDG